MKTIADQGGCGVSYASAFVTLYSADGTVTDEGLICCGFEMGMLWSNRGITPRVF